MKKIFSIFAAILFAGSMMAAKSETVKSTFSKTTSPATGTVTDLEGEVTWSIEGTVGAGEPAMATGTLSSVECLKFGTSKSVYFSKLEFSTDYFEDYNVTSVKIKVANNGKKTATFTATQGSTTIGTTSKEFGNTWNELTVNTNKGAGGTLTLTYEVEQALYLAFIEVTYEEQETACTNKITITKAENPDHGTFVIDNEGESCIDGGNASTTVTATPDAHYHLASVNATAGIVGAISGNKCEITEIDADATISVEFEEDAQYEVTWSVNGNADTKTQVYAGEKPVFPATPAAFDDNCTSFYGWATESWASKLENLEGKTVYTKAADMPAVDEAVTYYAVFAKAAEGAAALNTVVFNETFEDFEADNVPAEPGASATTYGATIAYACVDGGSVTKIYDAALAGGDAPELLVSKRKDASNPGSFAISGISTAKALALTLTYSANNNGLKLATSSNVSAGDIEYNSTKKIATSVITVEEGETFDLTFSNTSTSNTRLDNINISVSSVELADFITVKQGGSTAVDNTTVNKTVKTIENGMVIIEKNGVRYNVMGQIVK